MAWPELPCRPDWELKVMMRPDRCWPEQDAGALDHAEGALQVDGDHVVPLLLRHVENHPVAQDAGAGYHGVQLAKVVDGGLDYLLPAAHGGHRLHAGDGAAALLPDFRYHLLGDGTVGAAAVHVDARVDDDHLRALLGHQLGNAASHAPAGTGNDGYLVSEYVCHVCSYLGFDCRLKCWGAGLACPQLTGKIGEAQGIGGAQGRLVPR